MRLIGVCATAMVLAACGDGTATATAQRGERAGAGTSHVASPTVVSVSREFRDWRATCDNGNACMAYTGTDAGGWLRIALDAGPSAIPSIIVGKWFDGGEAAPGPVVLTIDGKRHATTVGAPDTGSYAIPATDVHAVLAELAQAKTVTIASGEDAADLSGAGAAAALLWIDDRQGRLDTTTALLRRGDRPASSVPSAPALPVVVAAPAIGQTGFEGGATEAGDKEPTLKLPAALEGLASVKSCREDTSFNEYLHKAVMGARLNDQTELWGVPCDGGAYNATYQFYLTGPGGIHPRRAAFPDADGKIAAPIEGSTDGLTNPSFDPATRVLSSFAKGRGIGDCGVSQTWVWTGQAFRLTREQIMGECWGMVSGFWPTTWRTR